MVTIREFANHMDFLSAFGIDEEERPLRGALRSAASLMCEICGAENLP